MGDVMFEGRQYEKEDFVYYPSEEEAWKRMRYCAAFWKLWKKERGIMGKKWRGKRQAILRKFITYFNKLYKERKREEKPIVWDDFRDWRGPVGGS